MKSTERAWKNRISNAQGRGMENEIDRACLYYRQQKIAAIEKTPEPFKVLQKHGNGRFTGMFTREKAQPDYKGILTGGTTIVFEAKSTMEDRIKQSAVTPTQADILGVYFSMGAVAFVCVAIQNHFFTIPWILWRDMKTIYGRKYLTAAEIQQYQVRYSMGVMFLEKIKEGRFCNGK